MLYRSKALCTANKVEVDEAAALTPAEVKTGLALLALAAVFRVLHIFMQGFDSDEPQHLHVAWGWAHGLIQYRDVFDNHVPLFHILCSFPVRWLGDRPDLLIWMRFAMLPLYALSVWATHKIAKSLFSARLAFRATILAALFPLFFIGTVEFRTDELWTAGFLLCLAVLIGGGMSRRRYFLAGFFLGVTFCTSLKTSLMLACIVASALVAFYLCGVRDQVRPSGKKWAGAALAFVVGGLILPAAICAWFYSRGALGALYYGAIGHNMLSNLGTYQHGPWKKLLFVPVVAILWLIARNIARHNRFNDATPRYIFIFLLAGFYMASVNFLWPLVTRQDFLPGWPLVVLILAPLLDWSLPLPLGALGNRPVAAMWVAAGIELALLIPVAPRYFQELKSNQKDLSAWRAVLELTTPSETVMDPKGNLIFRKRPFYWGLEGITRARMQRNLIPDTINADLIRNRTCVVASDTKHYPDSTRGFIAQNYLKTGPLRVAGQWLNGNGKAASSVISFTVAIPVDYSLATAHGPASGELDGAAYRGESRRLAAGPHTWRALPGPEPVALVWTRALQKNYSPFPARSGAER